jgi:hypothetical protein
MSFFRHHESAPADNNQAENLSVAKQIIDEWPASEKVYIGVDDFTRQADDAAIRGYQIKPDYLAAPVRHDTDKPEVETHLP